MTDDTKQPETRVEKAGGGVEEHAEGDSVPAISDARSGTARSNRARQPFQPAEMPRYVSAPEPLTSMGPDKVEGRRDPEPAQPEVIPSAGGRVSGDNAQDSIWRNVALELADQLVQVLSDLHNAWEFEVKTEKAFDGLMHAAITKAIQKRDCLHRRAEPGKEGA